MPSTMRRRDTSAMGDFKPREPLYERIARLVKERWVVMAFGLVLVLRLAKLAVDSVQLHSIWPIAVAIGVAGVMVIVARIVARQRVQRSMAMRTVSLYPIAPGRWPNLDEALRSYSALTGMGPPHLGLKRRVDTGERIDAELAYLRDEPDGTSRVVSPWGAPPTARATIGFNEAMLDTFSADELLAVMVHLVERSKFAQNETSRLVNGVMEADSKALLLTREHAALLRAIEKTSRDRPTPIPGTGSIHFSDEDLRPKRVSHVGLATEWVTRDRLADLREHLGAAALDVPESG